MPGLGNISVEFTERIRLLSPNDPQGNGAKWLDEAICYGWLMQDRRAHFEDGPALET